MRLAHHALHTDRHSLRSAFTDGDDTRTLASNTIVAASQNTAGMSRVAPGTVLAPTAATMRRLSLVAALAVLGAAWVGPLPALARAAFWAHMTIHMAVVAVAAPLLALALAGTRADPARRASSLAAPIPASIAELLVVWLWHTPLLHHAARSASSVFVLEQASFLLVGVLLWSSAVGGDPARQRWRSATGVAALLFTAVHMTLLGAIFALTPRPLYAHAGYGADALFDQHLGGGIMLLVGGASYLAGGLWLTSRILTSRNGPPLRRVGTSRTA